MTPSYVSSNTVMKKCRPFLNRSYTVAARGR
jgi:hypothetical protein